MYLAEKQAFYNNILGGHKNEHGKKKTNIVLRNIKKMRDSHRIIALYRQQ